MGAAWRADGGKASLRDAAGMQLDAFDAVWRGQSWLFMLEANKLQSRRRHAGKSSSAVRVKAIVRSLRNLLHGKTWGMLENASRIPLEPHSNAFNSPTSASLQLACQTRTHNAHALHIKRSLQQPSHPAATAACIYTAAPRVCMCTCSATRRAIAPSPRNCGRAHVQHVSAHTPTWVYTS